MILRVKKLHPEAVVPAYAHPGDAGMDLFALEDTVVAAGQLTDVRTGIAMEIPEGHAGLIWDKSGLAIRERLKVVGGVIDASYRGEIRVGITNLGNKDYKFEKGHKVAQMLIQKVEAPSIEESLEELSQTKRGHGRFGSTGK